MIGEIIMGVGFVVMTIIAFHKNSGIRNKPKELPPKSDPVFENLFLSLMIEPDSWKMVAEVGKVTYWKHVGAGLGFDLVEGLSASNGELRPAELFLLGSNRQSLHVFSKQEKARIQQLLKENAINKLFDRELA